ncbi:uncharacterized protein DDB_G0283357-like isoform X1 [Diorhabda sublineata]|uniref:uncharacterized protein DDB_G0283357-like isoform X1 n=1 Tax=Diorhabda sublineata TaxID=1163346 RepID=UPI0024E047BD|nr:uncharacterized protein DDB_G0283357-like isoform X1 [Diorhabda sublineata]XP_056632890.1 uncharacterized protein DDB_G0283357-like isoform X1 [Diorhabda sublineata]
MLPRNTKKYWNVNGQNVNLNIFNSNQSTNCVPSKINTSYNSENTEVNSNNAVNRESKYGYDYTEFESQHYRNSQQNSLSASLTAEEPNQYRLQHSNELAVSKDTESSIDRENYLLFNDSIFKNPGFYKPIKDFEETSNAPKGIESTNSDHSKMVSPSNNQSNQSSFAFNNYEDEYSRPQATTSYSYPEEQSSIRTLSLNLIGAASAYDSQTLQCQQYSHGSNKSNQSSFANGIFLEETTYDHLKTMRGLEVTNSQTATSKEPTMHYEQDWTTQTYSNYTSEVPEQQRTENDYKEKKFQRETGYKREYQFEKLLREKNEALGEHTSLLEKKRKSNKLFQKNVLAPIPSEKQKVPRKRNTENTRKRRSKVKESDIVSNTAGTIDNIQENVVASSFNNNVMRNQQLYKSVQPSGPPMMVSSGFNFNYSVAPNNIYVNPYEQQTIYSSHMAHQRNTVGQAVLSSATEANSVQTWPRMSYMNTYYGHPINPGLYPHGYLSNYLPHEYRRGYPDTQTSEYIQENDVNLREYR